LRGCESERPALNWRLNSYPLEQSGEKMSTGELKITLPFSLSEDEAKLLLAIKLYEVGKVSLGQAAKLAGFSKRAFIDVLGQHRIPIFDYPPEELRQEIDR
jgi:predicted HTH domain antitoxin